MWKWSQKRLSDLISPRPITIAQIPSSTSARKRTIDIMSRIVDGDCESFPLVERDFVDRRRITFRSGKGGDPAPNTVRGQKSNGPAFGGHGGSIVLRGSSKVENLAVLSEEETISAVNGGDGEGFSRGLHATDLIVDLPLGTIVRERVKTDRKTNEGRAIFAPRFLYQFMNDGETLKLCEGGRGGVAPETFKKRDGRRGSNGQKKSIDLELRLMNDCALIGLPNAGKTSIISSLTSSLTRIGPEPYSTNRPHLGTLQFKDGLLVKLLDLPGIVHGDAMDKSRGIRTLRHTYRSKILAYCIDVASEIDAFEQLEILRNEVRTFDPTHFDTRKEIVVATKCDALHKSTLVNLDSLYFRVKARLGDQIQVVGTSARFGLGINRLVQLIRSGLFPQDIGPVRERVPAEIVQNRHTSLPQ